MGKAVGGKPAGKQCPVPTTGYQVGGLCDDECRGCLYGHYKFTFMYFCCDADRADCECYYGTDSTNSLAVANPPSKYGHYFINGFALLGLGSVLYGAGVHYCARSKKQEGTHIEMEI